MRYYMVDPDNEDRLLKIPPSVVAVIQADAERSWQYPYSSCINYDAALAAIDALRGAE